MRRKSSRAEPFIVASSRVGDVKLELWTDGSCFKDDPTDSIGPAGSGIVCVDADSGKIQFLLGEYIGIESNNYAEFRAIEIGLDEVSRRYEVDESFDIEVVSDSKMAVNVLSGNWSTNLPEYREITARIQELEEELGVVIQYSWVKAHVGVHFNELADYLAYNSARGD